MMRQLNPRDATPLYIQLSNEIRRLIDEGTWKVGEQIVTEQALCDNCNVSRVTVRKALDLLVDEMVLFRKQGKGTFVSYPEFFETPNIRERSFTASMIHENIVPYTKIAHKSVIPLTGSLQKTFQITDAIGTPFIYIARIRYLDGEPVIFETDYFPTRFQDALDFDLENKSLYGLLHEKMGIEFVNIRDCFHVAPATTQMADYLNISVGYPLLRVSQTVLDNKLQPIYYNEQFIKTESYEYLVESFIGS